MSTPNFTSDLSPRQRIRDLIPKLHLGRFSIGPLNSITDVPGVLAHTQSIVEPATATHHEINTGITTILPRRDIWHTACTAGIFSFNGAGELTGSHWLNETGLLASPILITGTLSVGSAYEGAVRHFVRETKDKYGMVPQCTFPVVAETWEGYLSDAGTLAVRPEHVICGIDDAHAGPVAEGCTGGGTGMKCHGYKGGTGCASRKVPDPRNTSGESEYFTVGALVQANYGTMDRLSIGGVPVGLKLSEHDTQKLDGNGSIIIIIATDAPLQSLQLQRVAKRATVGLARVGGIGGNYSGDIFLAFSTASHVSLFVHEEGKQRSKMPEMLLDEELDPFFEATADAVEESIYNALCMAKTTKGPLGRTVEALPLQIVKELVTSRLL